MNAAPQDHMVITCDEDCETIFVLVNAAAPDEAAVAAGWRAAAKHEWGLEYDDWEDGEGPEIGRAWYKPHPDVPDEQFIQCAADDPARDDEWWSFELPPETASSTPTRATGGRDGD